MALDHIEEPRQVRPVPVSAIPRTHRAFRILATLHDIWLARRTAAQWRHELNTLDDRILRDIGANRDMVEDFQNAANHRHRANQRQNWRILKESTFPPHCEPDVAKLGSNIKA